MKTSRIYSIAAVCILLVIGGAAFAFAQAPSAKGNSTAIHPTILYPGATLGEKNREKLAANREKVEEVKKNIAIMEKVFDHVMEDEFGGDYVSEGFFSEGCRGYWIPGAGLLFMMKVKFPLKVDMAREERQEKEEPEDLWEEFEEQVESGKKPRAQNFFFSHANREERVKEINKKIDRLVSLVIDTLREYGHRMDEGFDLNQSIRVLVEGEGDEIPSMPEINVLHKSPPRPRNNAKARKEYKKTKQDVLEEQKAEIEAVKEEIEAQREEITEQARKIKEQAKYGGKIEKELDIESKRAKEIAEQVRESMSQAMKLAEQFMPEKAEWKDQMPSREEIQKMMPSEEEIKQFLPKEKDMKAIQEMLKGLQIPFLGGMSGEETHERTHMIFKVTFNKLHFLKDNPEKFREEVDIDVY